MQSLLKAIQSAFGTFRSKEQGTITVEFMIMLPLLVWGALAMLVFWDGFRSANTNQRTAYLVADLISREVDEIDTAYLNGLSDVARTLNDHDRTTQVRVTIVNRALDDDLNPIHEIDWSWGSHTLQPHTDVSVIEDRLPMMAVGDQLIFVESMRDWVPRFAVAELSPITFRYVAVTMPRFAPQIVRDDGSV